MNADLSILGGSASGELTASVCGALGVPPGAHQLTRFPDGEAQVELGESVRGRDLFLVQALGPPVEAHLFELLLLADACRRAGALRMTAVIPYLGYARQERRVGRRSLGARVMADALSAGRFDRLMLLDAHTPAIEGFFDAPVDHLTAVPLLARAAAASVRDRSVVVAPDLGAVKRARAFAQLLGLPLAIVHKTRTGGAQVEASEVVGEVKGCAPVIVDDMLSTGGTIEAAARVLAASGAAVPLVVVVTHALLVGRAEATLGALPIERLIASDSLALARRVALPLEVVGLGGLLAEAIRRAHRAESLSDLRAAE